MAVPAPTDFTSFLPAPTIGAPSLSFGGGSSFGGGALDFSSSVSAPASITASLPSFSTPTSALTNIGSLAAPTFGAVANDVVSGFQDFGERVANNLRGISGSIEAGDITNFGEFTDFVGHLDAPVLEALGGFANVVNQVGNVFTAINTFRGFMSLGEETQDAVRAANQVKLEIRGQMRNISREINSWHLTINRIERQNRNAQGAFNRWERDQKEDFAEFQGDQTAAILSSGISTFGSPANQMDADAVALARTITEEQADLSEQIEQTELFQIAPIEQNIEDARETVDALLELTNSIDPQAVGTATFWSGFVELGVNLIGSASFGLFDLLGITGEEAVGVLGLNADVIDMSMLSDSTIATLSEFGIEL